MVIPLSYDKIMHNGLEDKAYMHNQESFEKEE